MNRIWNILEYSILEENNRPPIFSGVCVYICFVISNFSFFSHTSLFAIQNVLINSEMDKTKINESLLYTH